MTAGSTLGYSRTPRNVNPMMPNTTIAIEITIVRIGRSMHVDERLTASLRRNGDGSAGLELEDPGCDQRVAGCQALRDLDTVLGAQSRAHGYRVGLAAFVQEHTLAAQLGHQRVRRHRDGRALVPELRGQRVF